MTALFNIVEARIKQQRQLASEFADAVYSLSTKTNDPDKLHAHAALNFCLSVFNDSINVFERTEPVTDRHVDQLARAITYSSDLLIEYYAAGQPTPRPRIISLLHSVIGELLEAADRVINSGHTNVGALEVAYMSAIDDTLAAIEAA